VSAWKTFRTLDPEASATRFVLWNDTHIHDDMIRQLRAAVLPQAGGGDITAKGPLFVTRGNDTYFLTPAARETAKKRSLMEHSGGPTNANQKDSYK
jgi:hypothetical protein